jgi:NDP-sugar pyrophosphorylase family protein
VRDMPDLFSDDILITNVDTLLDLDEMSFWKFHQMRGAGLSMAVTLNKNVPNEGALYINDSDRVIYSREVLDGSTDPQAIRSQVKYCASSTGAIIARKELLYDIPWQPKDGPLSLYGSIVGTYLNNGQMYAYNNGTNMFTDVGTVETWSNAQIGRAMLAPYVHRTL